MSFFRTLLTAMCLAPALGMADQAPIVIENAWVRALPPTQPNTAAYLTIENNGAAPIEVVGATASVAERVEFHTTREVDGYVRMEQLSTLGIVAGQSLTLAPGGTHLMLLGLTSMPQPGDSVKLCLSFTGGQQVCTDAPVRKAADDNTHQHHHH